MPDKGDLNKEFLLWAQRIEKENKINAKITGSPFTLARPPELVANKPTQENFSKRRPSLAEPGALLDNLKKAAAFPRDKFLLPQTTAQDLGWLLGEGKGLIAKGMHPSSVTTGLGNWRRNFPRPPERAETHHKGYVTMLGELEHPADMQRSVRKSLSVPSLDAESSDSPPPHVMVPQHSLRFLGKPVEDLPGDIHIKKHEWAYMRNQLRGSQESPQCKLPRRRGSSVDTSISEPSRLTVSTVPDGLTEVSKLWHKQAARINAVKRLMPNHCVTRWYKPLGNSDVSQYANDYVLSFGCGPFDKHQLLANR
ncbi:hypothetical protein FOL47_006667 [Perkinsus chesapeaki]|uniref:Uncharacterized protein n=1 Tax=Perkinsus chesapeaki TaxID=330153 RepID=A0A7J6LQP7_PERCH|nr:hypothetical protein FOL47_006667 [Perkinsus chesapeaki]